MPPLERALEVVLQPEVVEGRADRGPPVRVERLCLAAPAGDGERAIGALHLSTGSCAYGAGANSPVERQQNPATSCGDGT